MRTPTEIAKTVGVFWLGALIGMAALLLVFASISMPYGYSSTLYNYQSLLSGLFALFAGFLVWRSTEKQIAESQNRANEQLKEAELLARATLLMTLESFSEYVADCAAVQRLYWQCGAHDFDFFRHNDNEVFRKLPKLDEPALNSLINIVGKLSHEGRNAVMIMLQQLQLQRARFASSYLPLLQKVPGGPNKLDNIVHISDTICLSALVSRLYSFAREPEKDFVNDISFETLFGHMQSLEFFIENDEIEWSLLKRQFEKKIELFKTGRVLAG